MSLRRAGVGELPNFDGNGQVKFGKESKAAALKPIYTAAAAARAEQHLGEFEAQWGSRYPMIGRSWRGNWSRVIPFFQFPEEIRRVIYTTSEIEAMNFSASWRSQYFPFFHLPRWYPK